MHEHNISSGTATSWQNFPLSHPLPFRQLVLNLDVQSICNCKLVCRNWKNWFDSSSIWSHVMPRLVNHMFERRVQRGLEQVWDNKMDLLLDMVDECITEEQKMSMALRIERTLNERLWMDYEVKLM